MVLNGYQDEFAEFGNAYDAVAALAEEADSCEG
jgi:hypothetical protein